LAIPSTPFASKIMFSVVARQASRSSRQALRQFSADAEKKLNPFSMVDNPIGGGIVLLGLTAVMGVVMYKYDEELPQGPPKESA
jgi:hypothetical protein